MSHFMSLDAFQYPRNKLIKNKGKDKNCKFVISKRLPIAQLNHTFIGRGP